MNTVFKIGDRVVMKIPDDIKMNWNRVPADGLTGRIIECSDDSVKNYNYIVIRLDIDQPKLSGTYYTSYKAYVANKYLQHLQLITNEKSKLLLWLKKK
jgi:hypothetical protein